MITRILFALFLSTLSAHECLAASPKPKATTRVFIGANCDAEAPESDAFPPLFFPPPLSPQDRLFSEYNNIAEFSTTVDISDSLGIKHTLPVFFMKRSINF
jgi:hypothetical protein